MDKRDFVRSLHRMFITLKAKDEQAAIDFLNKKSFLQKMALGNYWKRNGFSGYANKYLGM